jgi:hypothetical protein
MHTWVVANGNVIEAYHQKMKRFEQPDQNDLPLSTPYMLNIYKIMMPDY